MEGPGGCSLTEFRMREWQRLSIFRSYTFPYMDRPNLTVLASAPVTRLIFDRKRAIAVEFTYQGRVHRIGAGLEVVLSLGAINTPKVLMQSGVGDETELERFRIPLVEHLPGVGQNLQDHVAFPGMIWECHGDEPNAVFHWFWRSDARLDTPDLQTTQAPLGMSGFRTVNPNLPSSGWLMVPAVIRTKSQGRVHLSGPDPLDPPDIKSNLLSHPDDVKALAAALQLCREIGNSAALRPFLKQEMIPGKVKRSELENYLRDTAISWWHQTCTAKMGRDSLSVVDGKLSDGSSDAFRCACDDCNFTCEFTHCATIPSLSVKSRGNQWPAVNHLITLPASGRPMRLLRRTPNNFILYGKGGDSLPTTWRTRNSLCWRCICLVYPLIAYGNVDERATLIQITPKLIVS